MTMDHIQQSSLMSTCYKLEHMNLKNLFNLGNHAQTPLKCLLIQRDTITCH